MNRLFHFTKQVLIRERFQLGNVQGNDLWLLRDSMASEDFYFILHCMHFHDTFVVLLSL